MKTTESSSGSGAVSNVAPADAPVWDRELLELAAKAAGIDLKFKVLSWSDGSEYPCYDDNDSVSACSRYTPVIRWNPLADDGDALRLAVKLGFINPGQWPNPAFDASRQWAETGAIDWHAATRRAIVRAAAAIAKAQP